MCGSSSYTVFSDAFARVPNFCCRDKQWMRTIRKEPQKERECAQLMESKIATSSSHCGLCQARVERHVSIDHMSNLSIVRSAMETCLLTLK